MDAKMLQLEIKRPDGSTMYQCMVSNVSTERFAIGQLIVEDGILKLVCCTLDKRGSVVRPQEPWIGDLNFSLKEKE